MSMVCAGGRGFKKGQKNCVHAKTFLSKSNFAKGFANAGGHCIRFPVDLCSWKRVGQNRTLLRLPPSQWTWLMSTTKTGSTQLFTTSSRSCQVSPAEMSTPYLTGWNPWPSSWQCRSMISRRWWAKTGKFGAFFSKAVVRLIVFVV